MKYNLKQEKTKAIIDYTLYLVTDQDLMTASTIEESVEQAILGGVTVVQLREKTASSGEFYKAALKARGVTSRLNVPLIINDRVDIALAVGADGIHVGQDDLPYSEVRRIAGQDMILGVSANNLAEAIAASEAGVDYIGVGAMFATATKTNTRATGMDELKRIRAAVDIPIVAIGGIGMSNVHLFNGTGIDGIAVVSAIVAQENATTAARELKSLFKP